MCGFDLVVSFDGSVDPSRASRVARLLRHRGPDQEGSFVDDGVAITALRLAIIDPDERGRQPFVGEDGRHVLCFNGAIYNYLELRDELRGRGRSFHTETDTEVLLEAYREWGPAALDRLDGMFAFAVWDRGERRLFCARDRFGVKPLYYRLAGRRLGVASEIKPLLLDAEPAAVNDVRLADFLARGHRDHTGETLFRGVLQLRPGHSLSFDAGGASVSRWWEPPLDGPERPIAEGELLALLEDVVRLHLRSDVPVGTCLSGGVDSATIVMLAARLLEREHGVAALGARQRTFTVSFDEPALDELPYAQLVADAGGAEAFSVQPDAVAALERLPRLVWHQDEPIAGASALAQWHVMELAREHGVTVLLDGQGADELFAGYEATIGYRLADLARAGNPVAAVREGAAFLRGRDRDPLWLLGTTGRALLALERQERLRERIEGVPRWLSPELPREPAEAPPPGRDLLRRRLGQVIRDELPSLLHNEDRSSMAFSLEARVPFLDVRVAELVLTLPAGDLLGGGDTKVALRRATVGLVPERVRARRRKLGFVAPERAWLLASRELVAEQLSGRFAERGWVRPEAVAAACAELRRGVAPRPVWRWLAADVWARLFLDSDRPPLDRYARP